jgi:phosphate transport system substrate-binding protein
MRGRTQRLTVVAPLMALALVGAACGGNGGGSDGDSALSGSLFISGSSTVEPISALVAELFNEENPDVAINVEGPGTGDGFELFCNGETDISDASRPIDEAEAALCADAGIEYTELAVAIDGISVLTSPETTGVDCLTFEDTYALMGPESEGFDTWAAANDLDKELGGEGNFPHQPLTMVAPGEESGTYDSFIDIVWGDIIEERGADEAARPDYQSSANDNQIIGGLAGTPFSLGWVGFSFYEQNQDVLKAIEIDGGEGCVAPTADTINSGEYPISRTLYIYVNKEKAAENPALAPFVDFYLTDTGLVDAVQQVGYVVLHEDVIAESRSTWQAERPAA